MAERWLPADIALALREPNLLVPNKKPIGQVKAKLSHPALAQLNEPVSVCIATSGGMHDVLNGALYTPQGTGSYDGRGWRNTAGSRLYFDTAQTDTPAVGRTTLIVGRVIAAPSNFNALAGVADTTARAFNQPHFAHFGRVTATTSQRIYDGGNSSGDYDTLTTASIVGSKFVYITSTVDDGSVNYRRYLILDGVVHSTSGASSDGFFVAELRYLNIGEASLNGVASVEYFANWATSLPDVLFDSLYRDVYQLLEPANQSPYLVSVASSASAGVTGTATASIDEADIVTGGKTIILTLTGDTWAATVGADNAITTALIAGIDSAQSEAAGWDAVVKANMDFNDVTRTSATVVTITLGAESTYDITAQETITVTVPATALVTSGTAVVATPTFTVDAVAGVTAVPPALHNLDNQFATITASKLNGVLQ